MAFSLNKLLTNVLKSVVLKDNFVMEGELKKWNGTYTPPVVIGSGQASANTVPNLLTEVRYSSGCMGSVNITSSYTNSGVTIAAGWYNYFYIPHRSGGQNGRVQGDNCNYGNLILTGMTVSNARYLIRFASGSIAKVYQFGDRNVTTTSASLGTSNAYSGTINSRKAGRLVVVTFEITCQTPANWSSALGGNLPATYDSKEVYGSLCGALEPDSVAVAIQSDGKVKFAGGTGGEKYTGMAYYISAS